MEFGKHSVMKSTFAAYALVQSVTISRLVAALVIAAIAPQAGTASILLLYSYALLSDLLDGILARKLCVTSHFGQILDIIADKALVAVSLLYAAAMGMDLLPLALIGARDLITLGMRAIPDGERQLLASSRWFGAMLMIGVVLATLAFALSTVAQIHAAGRAAFWVLAGLALINLISRIRLALAELRRAAGTYGDKQTGFGGL